MQSAFSSQLLDWYTHNARQLPWRDHKDPYAIWVSEIMLQQTRVETVKPYFERWMARFPTIQALAEASQQDVLAAWEGLGYYTRARNLHRAAQQVMEDFDGQLPRDPQDLQRLPGIGRYTAGAIASMAFGLDVATLDGNIRRVLARVFDVGEPAQAPEGLQRLWELAEEHLPLGHAGDYNQALMDLGSMLCTPRQPDCPRCPVKRLCQACTLGIQEQRPVVKSRPAVPHYTVTAAVIRREGQVLIAQRPAEGLLGGLWEFPGGKLQDGEDLPECLRREICEELGVDISVGAQIGVYRHAYTHFRVTLHAFNCLLEQGEPQALEATDLRWVPPARLEEFPMGKIDRQIATQINLSYAS